MNELAKTPETLIAQILALTSELEQTPGMTGPTAKTLISGVNADLSALKRLHIAEKYQHQLRSNRQQNCRELYALRTHVMIDKIKTATPKQQAI